MIIDATKETHFTSPSTYRTIFVLGFIAMSVSGWYLIEGLLNFSGDDSTRYMFIAGGIMFQITESVCFIGCASLDTKHRFWRRSLLLMGVVLFSFSVAVMTIAQKATLQAGENHAGAITKEIKMLEDQIESYKTQISIYDLNSKTESASKWMDSRRRGGISADKAANTRKEMSIAMNKVIELYGSQRQTAISFFEQVEHATGLPARSAEFYFLVSRSFLIELCGILLMSFASFVRKSHSANTRVVQTSIPTNEVDINPPHLKIEPVLEELSSKGAAVNNKPKKKRKNGVDYEEIFPLAKGMYESGRIKGSTQREIITAFSEHKNIAIGSVAAAAIKTYIAEHLADKSNQAVTENL